MIGLAGLAGLAGLGLEPAIPCACLAAEIGAEIENGDEEEEEDEDEPGEEVGGWLAGDSVPAGGAVEAAAGG